MDNKILMTHLNLTYVLFQCLLKPVRRGFFWNLFAWFLAVTVTIKPKKYLLFHLSHPLKKKKTWKTSCYPSVLFLDQHCVCVFQSLFSVLFSDNWMAPPAFFQSFLFYFHIFCLFSIHLTHACPSSALTQGFNYIYSEADKLFKSEVTLNSNC